MNFLVLCQFEKLLSSIFFDARTNGFGCNVEIKVLPQRGEIKVKRSIEKRKKSFISNEKIMIALGLIAFSALFGALLPLAQSSRELLAILSDKTVPAEAGRKLGLVNPEVSAF